MTKTTPKRKRNARRQSSCLRKLYTKSKGERERYSQLNTELQTIAGKDKKTFFNEQCKEVEENNRIGKTRDLFKKIRDTKGIFQSKMGSIKDRNGRDLTEADHEGKANKKIQIIEWSTRKLTQLF